MSGASVAADEMCSFGLARRLARFGRKERILAGDFETLVNYKTLGRDAALSIPTPDHYLPLLYVLATGQQREHIRFPVEGVDGGSIAMLAVQIG